MIFSLFYAGLFDSSLGADMQQSNADKIAAEGKGVSSADSRTVSSSKGQRTAVEFIDVGGASAAKATSNKEAGAESAGNSKAAVEFIDVGGDSAAKATSNKEAGTESASKSKAAVEFIDVGGSANSEASKT